MLRFAEEIILPLLDEERDTLVSAFLARPLNGVLAGAVLSDTDLTQLTVISTTPLDKAWLGPTLTALAQAAEPRAGSAWLTDGADPE